MNEQGRLKGPIFVVGNSRSGTTMMGRILRNHPTIFTLHHEMHFFEQLWTTKDHNRILSHEEAIDLAAILLSINYDGSWVQRDTSHFLDEAKSLIISIQSRAMNSAFVYEKFLRYITQQNGKTIPCDQTPRYILYLDEILKLYPDARIINMIRDPRATLLSQKYKWRQRWMGYKNIPLKESIRTKINYHPISVSMLWNASVRAVNRFIEHPRVLLVKYENIVADPESEVRRICDFLGVFFHKEMLEIPKIDSSLTTRAASKGKGIDRSSADAWKKGGLNPTEIYLCQKITETLMKNHGYQPISINLNPLRLTWYLVSLPVKLAVSFILNLKRMKNVTEAIKRRLA